jgi:hypothetical protein
LGHKSVNSNQRRTKMGRACHTINHEVNHLVNFMAILASSMPKRLWGLYGADTCLTRINRGLRYIESLNQPGIQHAHLEKSHHG